MSLKHKIAYWLLGTNREEIRKQFRRAEQEMREAPAFQTTEFKQLQGLLGIDWARKPEWYKVDPRQENFLIWDEADRLEPRRRWPDADFEAMLEDSRKTNNSTHQSRG